MWSKLMDKKIGAKYGKIVEDTKGVLNVFRSWQICHTKSEANYAVYELTKNAAKQVMDSV